MAKPKSKPTATSIKTTLDSGLQQVAAEARGRSRLRRARSSMRPFDPAQIRAAPKPKHKRKHPHCATLEADANVFTQVHQTWMNWGITDNPLTTGGELFTRKLFRPTDPYEIAQAIREAEDAGVTIRALGSGFSFSDAVMPQQALELAPPSFVDITPKIAEGLELGYGFAIDMTSCQKSLQATFVELVSKPEHSQRHYFVEGGITIQDLNVVLDHSDPRVALRTMGGSSGQTIAGAISTGTHGGDFDRAPLADQVQALYIIGKGGKHHWIERTANVTDRAKLRSAFPCLDDKRIHFDDHMLHTAMVAMGAMGVIYACVLEVVPQFSLVNWNRSSTWNKLTKQAGDKLAMVRDGSWSGLKTFLAAALKNGSSLPNQFAQVVINPVPHEDTGEFTCYVTNRATLPLQLVPSGPPSAGISGVTSDTLTNAVQNAPEATSVGWEVFGALVGGTLLGSGGMWAAGGMDLAKKVMLANSLSGEIADQALALISFAEQNNDAWMVRVVIDAILQATFPVSAQLPPEPTHGLANKVVKTIAAHPIPGPMIDTAYKVMTGGVVTSKIPVVSMEAAFPLEEALLFIDSALLHFAHTVFPPPPPSMFDMQKRPRIPAGYVSLRLCGKTEALLGMQKHDPTAMVEISLLGNPDDARMIQHFESIALGHESIFNSTNLPDVPSATLKHGILHWGQASGRMTKEDVHARYGKHVITQWTALQRELGGKTFVNAMMKRLGLA